MNIKTVLTGFQDHDIKFSESRKQIRSLKNVTIGRDLNRLRVESDLRSAKDVEDLIYILEIAKHCF